MKSSYWTTALYMKKVEQMNVLPPQLKRRCAICNNDQDLVEAFIENQEVFHKSCVSVYNKQKLNRKRKHAELLNVRDAPENSSESDPIKVRVTLATLIYKIAFQIFPSVEKKIVERSLIDVKHFLSTKK